MVSWFEQQEALVSLARRQLFFIGGAPRSGTTWLQQMLNCHPEISCAGEGLFWRHLALPLEQLVADRRKALEAKNTTLFVHTGGYPLPTPDHIETLLGSAILLALRQQSADPRCHAVGEKTPENVFFFPRLKKLFPTARFIGIARDPRDVLASSWFIFHGPVIDGDENAAKEAFIRTALPPMSEGSRIMLEHMHAYPDDCRLVTYEALRQSQPDVLADLFSFLDVSTDAVLIDACIASTRFAAQTNGRMPGIANPQSFLRNGQVGSWRTILTPRMNELILQHLGWTFPHFGWRM